MNDDNVILYQLPNGMSIAVDKDLNITNIPDELIMGIYSLDQRKPTLEDKYLDDQFKRDVASKVDLLKEILLSCDKKERIQIISNINTREFIPNVRYIYKAFDKNITKEQLIDIFKNNKFLFTNNISNIVRNYEHIRQQQLINGKDLDNIYMGNSIENITTYLNRILREKGKIPKSLELLSINQTPESVKELVDNLRFTIRVNGIIDSGDLDRESKKYFERTLFENLTKYDNTSIVKEVPCFDHFVFDGVRGSLSDIINKMNPNFIDDLNKLKDTENFSNFLGNLNTVKNWSNYQDKVQRASDLQTELVTKLIYGTVKKAALNYIGNDLDKLSKDDLNKLNTYIMNGDPIIDYKNIHIDEELLKNITSNNMETFFDEKRRKSNQEMKFVNIIRNKLHDVYFPSKKYVKEVEKKGTQKKTNEDKKILENLGNNLLNKFPSGQRREEIVNLTKKLIDDYNNPNTPNKNKSLYKLYKIINYYLIVNNEYDIQNYNQAIQKKDATGIDEVQDVTILAKKIFSDKFTKPSYNNNDKLLYSLYNSNRLAHSVELFGIYRPINDNFVMNQSKGVEKNDKTVNIKKYSYLQRFGIDVEYINKSIDDYNSNNGLTIYNIIDKGNDDILLNYINSNIDVKYKNINREEITSSNIKDIKDALEKIKNNKNNTKEEELRSKKVRDEMYYESIESNMLFTVKKFLIDKVVNTIESKAGKKLEDMTLEDKHEVEKKNKITAEYQVDGGNNVVLVCYSEKFNNAFSVHDISNTKVFDKEKLKKEETISHTKNHGGLIENQKNKKIIPTNLPVETGFNGEYSPLSALATKIHNFFTFDNSVEKSKEQSPKQLLKKLKKTMDINGNVDFIREEEVNVNDPNRKKTLSDTINSNRKDILNEMLKSEKVKISQDSQLSLFGRTFNIEVEGRKTKFTEQELGKDSVEAIINSENFNNKKR